MNWTGGHHRVMYAAIFGQVLSELGPSLLDGLPNHTAYIALLVANVTKDQCPWKWNMKLSSPLSRTPHSRKKESSRQKFSNCKDLKEHWHRWSTKTTVTDFLHLAQYTLKNLFISVKSKRSKIAHLENLKTRWWDNQGTCMGRWIIKSKICDTVSLIKTAYPVASAQDWQQK
jgi:hypothetical protein